MLKLLIDITPPHKSAAITAAMLALLMAGQVWAQYAPREGVVRVQSAGPALSGCGMMGKETRIRITGTGGMFDPQKSRDRTPQVQLTGSGPIEFNTGSSWQDSPVVVDLPNRDTFVRARQKGGSGGTTQVLFSIAGCADCDGSPGATDPVTVTWRTNHGTTADSNCGGHPSWWNAGSRIEGVESGGTCTDSSYGGSPHMHYDHTDTRPYTLGPQQRFTLAADRGGMLGGC